MTLYGRCKYRIKNVPCEILPYKLKRQVSFMELNIWKDYTNKVSGGGRQICISNPAISAPDNISETLR